MRLPRWWTLAISVGLLVAAGIIGVHMNDAALRTAERVHRTDAEGLTANNANLTEQYMLLSAKELANFARDNELELEPDSADDRRALNGLVRISSFFRYAAVIVDPQGRVLSSSNAGKPTLPPLDSPGFAPMQAAVVKGKPGFSSLLSVGDRQLLAVAIPLVDADRRPIGELIGFSVATTSQFQQYATTLNNNIDILLIDTNGMIASSNKANLIGGRADAAILAAIKRGAPGQSQTIEFDSGGQRLIASLKTSSLGWTNVHQQTVTSFYGAVRASSNRTNLAMLALILLGIASLAVLAYRGERNVRRSHARFRALVQNAMDSITVLDDRGAITWDSPSVERNLGFGPASRYGIPGYSTLHPDDQPAARAVFTAMQSKTTGNIQRLQARVRHANGHYYWCDLILCNLLENPAIRGVVVNTRDISDSRELQDRLRYQAQHDLLTGLPNRSYGHDRLRARLTDEANGTVAVLFIDLDGFKAVNDTYGHDAGDEVLRSVAHRIEAAVRAGDTVARVGGDEFIVVLGRSPDREEIDAIAARIVSSVEQPVQLGNETVKVAASVGIRVAQPGDEPDEVLRSADIAMYIAKRAGGGRVERDELTW